MTTEPHALTKPTAGRKVPITLRALIARINRKLKPDMEALKATRGERARADLGDFYVVDIHRNFVVAPHVNPERYGRELGVLRDYEVVIEQDG